MSSASGVVKEGLRQKLLRSHLSVAAIGVVILLVALGGTITLRASAIRLAVLRGPTASTLALALSGVQHSFVALRGWMALGDQQFKEERMLAWQKEIWPAFGKLKQLSARWTQAEGKEQLRVVEKRLSRLSGVQWWIEDVAQTLGNEPALLLLEQEIEPISDSIFSAVTALITLEKALEGDVERKIILGLMADFRGFFSRSHGLLTSFIETGEGSAEEKFGRYLDRSWDRIERMSAQFHLLTVDQVEQLEWIEDQLLAYEALAQRAIGIRTSDKWNVARHLLAKEAVPHALEINEMLAGMSANQGERMQQEAEEVALTSNTAVILLVILITVMSVLAIVVSLRSANRIAQPISTLSRATQKLATGQLHDDIPIRDEDEVGQLTGAFNTMRASLQKTEAQLAQRMKEIEESKSLLEKVNKELDRFVYTASHDLRAPLRAIESFGSFLDEDYKDKLGPEGQEFVHGIRKSSKRMTDMINDLLALSKISRIKNPFETVDVNNLLGSVTSQIEYEIQRLNVKMNIQKALPSVCCDRVKMGVVFLNLISNGIKFSSKKEKEPQIEIGYDDKQEFHEFSVRDNGIGIPEEHLDSVFNIFKRLHRPEEYEGTGAGLNIVQKIIEEHNGKIWVESEFGHGTTFRFLIPKNLSQKRN